MQCFKFFHDGGPYPIEISPFIQISPANQWTVFYMIRTSVMKELLGKVLERFFSACDNITHFIMKTMKMKLLSFSRLKPGNYWLTIEIDPN